MLGYRHVLRGAEEIHAAFTDRYGGYSEPPFQSFNLGDHVGDDPSAVWANRAALASVTGLAASSLAFMSQVHGRDVFVIDRPGFSPGDQNVVADALVTDQPGIALVVLVADCTPVLLADADAGVVGVAHVGRRGLVAGVIPAVVESMHRLGASTIAAIVGPSICGRCYEVPAEMRAEVGDAVPVAAGVTSWGTPSVDVAGGAVSQLASAGVDVDWLGGCTRERDDLFSYRRDGSTGRFGGLVWISRGRGGEAGRRPGGTARHAENFPPVPAPDPQGSPVTS